MSTRSWGMGFSEMANKAKEAAQEAAAAVQEAVTATSEELRAKFSSRQGVLEQQLVTTTKQLEGRIAAMHSEEAVRVLVAKAREEASLDKTLAVDEAMELSRRKAEIQLAKMSDGIGERVREAVQARERELRAENGRLLRELKEADGKEHVDPAHLQIKVNEPRGCECVVL